MSVSKIVLEPENKPKIFSLMCQAYGFLEDRFGGSGLSSDRSLRLFFRVHLNQSKIVKRKFVQNSCELHKKLLYLGAVIGTLL